MSLNTVRFEELEKPSKTLLKTRIPTNTEIIKQNTFRIVGAYNGYLYELEHIKNKSTNPITNQQIDARLKLIRNKLQRVFELINYDLEVKHSFVPINSNNLIT